MKTKKETKSKKTASNYAFIDSQNLHLSIREQGWNIDFRKFRNYLKDKYNITKAYLFIGYVAENQGMYTQLQKYGFILVFKPTLVLPSGKPKGNVDAELVLHAMIEYPNYDRASIDGSFYFLSSPSPETPGELIYGMGLVGNKNYADNPPEARIWLYPLEGVSDPSKTSISYPLTERDVFLMFNALPYDG